MRKTDFTLVLAIGLIAAGPGPKELFADEQVSSAQNTLTPEQRAALAAVDVRLASVEDLAAKIDDPDYRATVAKQIENLNERRLALEENFDPALHESLMHSVISRYQVMALWLKPPDLAPPAAVALEAIQEVVVGNARRLRLNGKPCFRRTRRCRIHTAFTPRVDHLPASTSPSEAVQLLRFTNQRTSTSPSRAREGRTR